jgi:transcriptional regulator with XRE-family HTH domain
MERGLSQQQLADELGINQQSINGYENRATEPDIEMLIKLADFFRTSVDYLIGYEATRDSKLRSVSPEEIRLLENLRLLSAPLQKNVRELMINAANALQQSSANIDE